MIIIIFNKHIVAFMATICLFAALSTIRTTPTITLFDEAKTIISINTLGVWIGRIVNLCVELKWLIDTETWYELLLGTLGDDKYAPAIGCINTHGIFDDGSPCLLQIYRDSCNVKIYGLGSKHIKNSLVRFFISYISKT